MTLRHLAPAGSPIRATEIARWMAAVVRGSSRETLAAMLRARFGGEAFLTCTGRAGLSVLLRAMRRISPGEADEVIVPAYTCYSVPASIVSAGLRPRVVDVDPVTLDYDFAALAHADCRRVLAIIATNLYGAPSDLLAIEAFAREHGVRVVDDAAQAMGATIDGRDSGTFGDAGLYSFDKGKNVAAIDGGVLTTRWPELAGALATDVAALPEPTLARRAEHVVKAFVYASLLHPRLYWIPNGIPQLGLGGTAYITDIVIEQADPTLAALATVMLGRLDVFAEHRRFIAAAYADALQGLAGVETLTTPRGRVSAALRFPVLVSDADRRATLLAALNEAGVGASPSYPSALVDVPGLRDAWAGGAIDTPGGRSVAARILTLPTHPHVTLADVRRVADIFHRRSTHAATAPAPLGAPTSR